MTQRQQDYYAETASAYDSMHVQPGDAHFIALEYVAALLHVVRAKSVLDVGSGTGRAIQFLRQRCPDLRIEGVEPVSKLREQARVPGAVMHDASGEDIPFHDGSFDVVMSFGLLHHVPATAPVITEMTRVVRFGVMISDANRFGQGSTAVGLLKLAVHRAGLWPTFERFRTKGRGYMESDGMASSTPTASSTRCPNCGPGLTEYSLSRPCLRRDSLSCISPHLTVCSGASL